MLPSSICYVLFDCYGTLTDFRIGQLTPSLFADRVTEPAIDAFIEDFTAYRFDEVLGSWKPYPQVLHDALERTCGKWSLSFTINDVEKIVDAVPTWGPHEDVPAALAKVAKGLLRSEPHRGVGSAKGDPPRPLSSVRRQRL